MLWRKIKQSREIGNILDAIRNCVIKEDITDKVIFEKNFRN